MIRRLRWCATIVSCVLLRASACEDQPTNTNTTRMQQVPRARLERSTPEQYLRACINLHESLLINRRLGVFLR
jgi:hypothetical protein